VPLFSGPDGGRLTVRNLRRAVDWEKVRIALGSPDLRVHDLRHNVQAVLGHSSF
jgi:integrase